jgi:hypothetical protein
LTRDGFAARFKIHVPGQANEIPPFVSIRIDRLQRENERCRDQAEDQGKQPKALVACVPEETKIVSPIRYRPGDTGREFCIGTRKDHIVRIDSQGKTPGILAAASAPQKS